MQNSTMYPPNVHKLSDGVIGKVIPSLLWPKSGVGHAVHCNASISTTTSRASAMPPYFQLLHESVSWPILSAAPIDVKDALNSSKDAGGIADHAAEKDLVADEKCEKERERCRTSMQRHRKRIRDHAIAVERDVGNLREETHELQLQCQKLSSGVPTGTSALTVVGEYFRLFRYGLKAPGLTNGHGTDTKVSLDTHVSSMQRDFLVEVASPDVAGETGFGVERLIEDYERLAHCLPELDNQLVRLDTGPGDLLTATTTVAIVVTASTLHFAFPHLAPSSPLAAKLLNHRFVLRGSVQFKWDSITSRLKLVQSRADFLTPMLELLDDLDSVSRVFDNALITPDCKLHT